MAAGRSEVRVKRVYDPVEPADGRRVLVDRVWPRGVSRDAAHLDDWCKDVAPSTELRRWYDHDPEKFAEFERRYRAELADSPAAGTALDGLRGETRAVTLLTASRAVDISQAAVLARLLRE